MKKSIDYYISKGFDLKTAKYFASGRKKATNVTAHPDYTLTILFDNGEKRIYDVSPLIQPNSIFQALSDLTVFYQVYVDENGCIAWNTSLATDRKETEFGKIDLCSDSCYMDSVLIT